MRYSFSKNIAIGGVVLIVLICFTSILFVNDSDALGRWRLLGKKVVNGKVDHDSIVILDLKKPLRVLKFHVKGSAVKIHKIIVTFASGKQYKPNTKLIFKKGSWSRKIDLPGKDRIVKRVDFHYGNLPLTGRARIKLFGR